MPFTFQDLYKTISIGLSYRFSTFTELVHIFYLTVRVAAIFRLVDQASDILALHFGHKVENLWQTLSTKTNKNSQRCESTFTGLCRRAAASSSGSGSSSGGSRARTKSTPHTHAAARTTTTAKFDHG